MGIYYIDPVDGSDSNDGLHASTPKRDINYIDAKPGDSILFKRGSFIRAGIDNCSGRPGKPIVYGAYGEGANPIFCGSLDLSSPDDWAYEKDDIWLCTKPVTAEVCNIVFNHGEHCGSLKWEKSELSAQGDWHDLCFCCQDKADKPQHIYLKSQNNPGIHYSHIECVTLARKIAAGVGHDIIYENLSFENWMFAIAGSEGGRNITVRNCTFRFIGGGVWRPGRKIRYGNAVEFWDVCENVTVEKCIFEDIYDSGVTHQGGKNCKPPVNLHVDNNLFIKCGMGAYEGRDRVPINSSFNNNICVNAGCGFSKNGATMPRCSEIWPQPMGHHVFLWRMEQGTEKGKMQIKGNVFCHAPYGAPIYSIISEEAESQFEIANNSYCAGDYLLARRGGIEYTSFESYCQMEGGCKFEDIDIERLVDDWKKQNGYT